MNRLNRWHVAGFVRRVLPDLRGSDRIFSAVRGKSVPRNLVGVPTTLRFGPGLCITVDVAEDGSFGDVFFAQYRRPSLAPVLEACLRQGDTFVDVGANVGVYTLWASRLVGSSGSVHAFEPAPLARSWLCRAVDENDCENVSVIPLAVADRAGELRLRITPGASGLSSATEQDGVDGDEHPREVVSVTTLDDYWVGRSGPALVKIDVEGLEPRVLKGMSALMRANRPVVVFESPDFGGGAGTADAVAILRDHGYRVYSLRPRGLVDYAANNYSHNLLALHPEDHESLRRTLRGVRFHRSQNC